MKNANLVGAAIGVALVVGLGMAVEVYRWNECRQVGHGVLYCILNMGGR